ncbi:MAG TPA: hypothetical protein ENH01_02120, partial [Nitrospirae bacterium]|nr:hypothetical protein [Nitrospirota bacterium]
MRVRIPPSAPSFKRKRKRHEKLSNKIYPAHFSTVGLPDTAVKESKNRVRTALKNTGFNFPLKQITVNLAPADIKKEGS